MKLAAKYALVLIALMAVILPQRACSRIRRDAEAAKEDMKRDHRTLGRLLGSRIAEIWESSVRVPERTRHLIDAANAVGGPTQFEWVPGQDLTGEQQRLEGGLFVSRFPVSVGGAVVGAVVVREPRDQLDAIVRENVRSTAWSMGLFGVLFAVTIVLLGGRLIGRPIALLVAKARRTGAGDLAGPLVLSRSDELGELAAEMNAMCASLAQAQERIVLETRRREVALQQLRHAERLAIVGKLAAGIAHELGTPLSIVGGHAQMIAAGEVTGDQVVPSAAAIDREASRMGQIVRKLLDFARRKGPEGTVCAVDEALPRFLDLLRPMSEQARVETALEVAAPGPLRAVIDETSLQQVVTNLVVNALQAMPGGGALRIALRRERRTPPSGDKTRPYVRIDVADSGPGIAPDALPHIFEPFFTTKEVGEGTGLGLAVVHGIVYDHEGWITVDTSPRGAVFSVFLPEASA